MKTFNIYAKGSNNLILAAVSIREIVVTFGWLSCQQIDDIAKLNGEKSVIIDGMIFQHVKPPVVIKNPNHWKSLRVKAQIASAKSCAEQYQQNNGVHQ